MSVLVFVGNHGIDWLLASHNLLVQLRAKDGELNVLTVPDVGKIPDLVYVPPVRQH